MKKVKKGFSILIGLVILGFIFILGINGKMTAVAVSTSSVKINYRIFDYNDNYKDYLAKESSFYDDANTVLSNAFGPTNTKGVVTEFSVSSSTHATEIADAQKSWATDADYGPDCDQTGLSYYGYDIFELLGVDITTDTLSFKFECPKKNFFDLSGVVYTYPAAEKTEFKASDDIVIEPWVTVTNGALLGAQLLFDQTPFASSYSIVTADDLIVPAYGDTTVSKMSGSYPTVGFTYTPDSGISEPIGFYSGTSVRAGAVHVKLDSTLSAGNYDVSYSTVSSLNIGSLQVIVGNAGSEVYKTTDSIVTEKIRSFSIEGSGNSTDLKTTTINGTTFSASTTPSITDVTDGSTVTGVSTASTFKVAATVTGGGTVTGVKFGTSSTDTTYTAADNTASTGTWDCDISDHTKFEPGDNVYITVYTKSGDGSANGSYVLIVTKDKLSTAELENAVLTYTVGSTETTATLNTAFTSGTVNYTLNVPTGATVKITPTYDVTNDYRQTCYVNGATSSTASGTQVTLGTSASATSKTYNVKMKSQDGTATKTYAFKVTYIDNSVELTNLQYLVSGGAKTNLTYNSTSKEYTVSGIKYAIGSFTLYPVLANSGQTVTITDSGTSSAVTTSGKSYNFVDNTTDKYASTTKTLTMKVTSAFGDSATYTINVTRDKADETTSLTSIKIKYTDASGAQTVTATKQSDGTYLVQNVPFKVTSYTVVSALDTTAASLQSWSIDAGTTKLASGATSAAVSFASAGADGGDAVSSTTTVRVYSQNLNVYLDYTLKVERKEADRTLKFDSLTITDNSGTSLGTFNVSAQTFTINSTITKLASSTTSITATTALPSGCLCDVYIGKTVATATKQTYLTQNFSSVVTVDDTINFAIYIMNETGTTSTPITVSFTRAAADDTNTITVTAEADIAQTASSSTTLTISTSGVNYSVSTDYETAYVEFTLACTDPSKTDTEIYINGSKVTSTYKYTFTSVKTAITNQKVTVNVYTAAHPYSSGTPSKVYYLLLNRDAANDDHSFTLDMTDVSGVVQTKSSTSTATRYEYTGLDISATGAFSTGLFKIAAAANNAKSTIYVSDTSSNFMQSVYNASSTYSVGSYPSGKTLYVTCYSQYGNHTTIELYTCEMDTRDNNNTITNITIDGVSTFAFSASTNTYNVEVPFTTKTIKFTVTKDSLKSSLGYKENGVAVGPTAVGVGDQTVDITTSTLTAGSTMTCVIQATAENTSAGTAYTIKVKRLAGETGCYLETLSINGINAYGGTNNNILETYTTASTNIDFVMPNSSTAGMVAFTISAKASYTLTNVTAGTNSTANPYNFSVTSGSYTELQFSIQSEYNSVEAPTTFNVVTVRIYSANKDATLSDLELFQADGKTYATDASGSLFTYNSSVLDQGTFTAPYSVGSAVCLTATATDSTATISGDGNKSLAAGGTIKYKVVVTSQYAALNTSLSSSIVSANNLKKEYILTVKRNTASTVCTLDSLVIKDTAGNVLALDPTFSSSNGTYKIENLADSITKVNLSYTKTDPNSTVTGNSGDITLSLPSSSTELKEQDLTLLVTAEDATYTKTYTVTLSRTQIVLEDVFDIDNIVVSDGTATTYAPFVSTTYAYTVALPATQGGVSFNVSLKSLKASIEDGSGNSLSTPFLVTLSEGETKTVTIVGKSQKGTYGTSYVYTVTRSSRDTDATLKSLSYNGVGISDFASSKESYTINLTHDVETFYLEGVPSKTTSSITANTADQATPINLVDGNNGVYTITIVAENTAFTKVYSVTVIRDASSDLASLTALDLLGDELVDKDNNKLLSFAAGTDTYSFNVGYDVADVNLDAVAVGGSLVTVTGAGTQTLNEGLNEFTITVTPASGLNVKEYKINITRGVGDVDNTIKTYKYYASLADKNHVNETTFAAEPILTELNINSTDTEYTYAVSRDITTFEPEITLNSSLATYTMPSNLVIKAGQKNTFEIVVKSQTGAERKYRFNVYSAATSYAITDINLKTSSTGDELVDDSSNVLLDYVETTNSYTIDVNYSQSEVYLETLLESPYATIKYSKDALTYSDYASQKIELVQGTNKYYFYAISEYGKLVNDGTTGKSAIYCVVINRKAANGDPTLKSLVVTIAGVNHTLDATLDDLQTAGTSVNYDNYTIADIGDTVTSLTINAVANNSATKVSGQIGTQTLSSLSVSGASTSGYIFSFVVTTEAEDGSKNNYTITVSRGKIDLDSDNNIIDITLLDSLTNSYLTYNASTTSYNVEIPYSINGTKITSYTINASKLSISPATITGAGSFTFDNSTGDYSKTHTVYATSQSGVKGTVYTINVVVKGPSVECRLASLYINGELMSGFSSDVYNYVYGTVDNTTTSISISGVAIDSKAVVTGDIGSNIALEPGTNSFTLIVTAENGKYSQYKVSINRDYPTPYLTDLAGTGISLLDTSDKATTFSSDVTSYHSIVSYINATATITAAIDDTNYVVSCSNSTPIATTGVNRSFNVNLDEGNNEFQIKVTSKGGKSKTYTYIISRRSQESANTAIASLSLSGVENEVTYLDDDYSNLVSKYSYTVPNKVRNLELDVIPEKIADANGAGATVTIVNDKNLKVGDNTVYVLVTAEDGSTSRTVEISVTREPYAYDVSIEQISDFEKDYQEETYTEKTYTVASNISSLNFKVANSDTTDTAQPTYEVISGKNLSVGENEVTLQITSYDGIVTTEKVKVVREAMAFTVLEDNGVDSNYKCVAVDAKTNTYSIDLGENGKASDVTNYEAYISYDKAKNSLVVTNLSDTSRDDCSEVILQVQNEDGTETSVVKIQLQSTTPPVVNFDVYVWIILGIAIILLIIILICVNRDKYGSVSRKRKAN